ncbi:hypothetical protein OTB20_24125 [Streptomyces sp. H27-H1]|uniref:hypothetical protein n=1 Tax=Streptomyces sp. H27-H1 TaxID=2996461 RepID=UPI00226D8C47|nr:hypothetical protein [Streptomyces sp. H27-H1]MCY0929229.1 hypothetical protein [Streptomyces sp. H27-H1]
MTYEVDQVGRLRIMAAGIPGAKVVESVLPAHLEAVWAVMSDLEGEFGRFQPDMRSMRVLRVTGDRVEALARSKYGLRAHFRGVLRPGWCWLQSRFLIIGMAAAPEPGGSTRVALTGGVRVPGRAAIVPVGAERELRQAMIRLSAGVPPRVGGAGRPHDHNPPQPTRH